MKTTHLHAVAAYVFEDLPMTQVELASELGVSQPTVSRWVNGENTPTLEQMREVASVCGRKVLSMRSSVELFKLALSRIVEEENE